VSRPKNKQDLQKLSLANYERLLSFINSLNESEKATEFPKNYLNRNIRDVLAHLHHWHIMFLEWYNVGMGGEKPDIPAKEYTWKTTPQLNKEIQIRFSNTHLEKIEELLNQSHKKIMKIIDSHSENELFEKKRYKWTGSTSLGSYLVGATSSHYDWAYRLIKKCVKISRSV
jgi:hypothetical protein